VTIELALSGVPMVVAYRIERWLAPILARFLKVETVVLANLVLGERVVPEFLQWHATVDGLSAALLNVLKEGPTRHAQLAAFARLDEIMATEGVSPSRAAARTVLSVYEQKTGVPVLLR
jgi:lipid-A-disaccharide synthase